MHALDIPPTRRSWPEGEKVTLRGRKIAGNHTLPACAGMNRQKPAVCLPDDPVPHVHGDLQSVAGVRNYRDGTGVW